MVKIRLARVGRKKRPSYRVVAIDSHAKRNADYLENLGSFNPSESESSFTINKEKYENWVKKGAQPTKAVALLLDGKYVYKPYPAPKVEEAAATAKQEDTETTDSNEVIENTES